MAEKFVSNPGNRYRPKYEPQIGEDGIIELKQIDVIDQREAIQADAPYCDINYLLKRYAAGDTSVLSQRSSFYADVTSAPKSLAEAYALNAKCERVFAQLPLEVRERFGHNYYKFLEAAGTPEFAKIFEKPVETEVKESAEA